MNRLGNTQQMTAEQPHTTHHRLLAFAYILSMTEANIGNGVSSYHPRFECHIGCLLVHCTTPADAATQKITDEAVLAVGWNVGDKLVIAKYCNLWPPLQMGQYIHRSDQVQTPAIERSVDLLGYLPSGRTLDEIQLGQSVSF